MPDSQLAETLMQISQSMTTRPPGTALEVPEEIVPWIHSLVASAVVLGWRRLFEGDMDKVETLMPELVAIAFYTGLRAARGGQEIPDPKLVHLP